ncbi:sulfurtransferase complex subunit TusB [Pelagibaculum spongiae]|uniref:Sulfurtransferase complex subunit TusB n=1 Tax=Pelagibaculum spongiae TaxID=2080658 RepID=A0A2V1H2N0_9GAMM|nr:sulfurtransferase complex subunit TusB [Pelagibaculum spongiae]PVZ71478.1 sulfurtransferase complex subunit TusB [Pelagibaculum spongiae]
MANCLHLVFEPQALENSLRCFDQQDSLVLIGNGVAAAIDHQQNLPSQCFVIADEFIARGFDQSLLTSDQIQLIDMMQLVELTETHSKSVSWK